MRDDRYLGAIYHHRIKGMKLGVRRLPEELGHIYDCTADQLEKI